MNLTDIFKELNHYFKNSVNYTIIISFVLVWWLNFSITLSITILTILSNDNTHMMHEGEKSFIKKSFILDIPSIYI